MRRMISQHLQEVLEMLAEKISKTDDGALSVYDAEVRNAFSVNASKIINLETEQELFPLENNTGKVLAVNEDEDGFVAVPKNSLLYLHIITESTTGKTMSFISKREEYTTLMQIYGDFQSGHLIAPLCIDPDESMTAVQTMFLNNNGLFVDIQNSINQDEVEFVAFTDQHVIY